MTYDGPRDEYGSVDGEYELYDTGGGGKEEEEEEEEEEDDDDGGDDDKGEVRTRRAYKDLDGDCGDPSIGE